MRSRFLPYLAGALVACAGLAWHGSAMRADENQAAPPPGVDVQARGPVHEAYAEPADVRPEPGPVVPQQPPDPVAEMPPDQKPAGDNVAWIPGYWSWDNEASTFTWVSGFWRTPPPGRTWTPGHWQQVDGGWQWTPGFWAPDDIQEVEYLPPPPQSIDNSPSTPPPDEASVYVPGCWVYQETRYLWRPGYWVEYNPDWVWIPDHYCWTPAGYVFVTGYWDFPLEGRGLLFAPVRFERDVLAREDFVYTPEFVVQPDFLLTALFVRPAWGHYYFGDYFDPRYEREGFTAWIDYRVGRHAFDPNFAFYQRRYREDRWATALRDLYKLRREGDAPRPPRTWTQQKEIVNKLSANQGGEVAISQNVNVTKLQSVAALAPIRTMQNVQVTGLAALAGARADGEHAPTAARRIQLETLPKERRVELGQEAKKVHEFAAAQQREQAKLVADGGAPVKPDDRPKVVKVQPPKLPARPQETRPEQTNPAPKPPPPPPASKHEERPIPPQEPPKPPAPPKTPPTTPREPPPAPPTPPPKEPPTPPPAPPTEPPTPPREPPKLPMPPTPPPPAPKQPPAPPPPAPKQPPAPPPPAPKEPTPHKDKPPQVVPGV